MAKFVERDQSQLYLLPVGMRDWVPEDDLSHFVVEAVNRVPMSAFVVNERGTGSAQYHPRMMLALLVYCYANGIFGSRRIERATYRDIGVRYVASNCHPDHNTICPFRRNNFEAVATRLPSADGTAAAAGEDRPLPTPSTDGGTGVRDRQADDGLPTVPAARHRQGPGRMESGDTGLQLPASAQPGKSVTGTAEGGMSAPPEGRTTPFAAEKRIEWYLAHFRSEVTPRSTHARQLRESPLKCTVTPVVRSMCDRLPA